MDFLRDQVRQWKVVVFYVYTCIFTVLYGAENILVVYIVDVKNLMELTQTQVELISAIFLIGAFFMLPFYPMYRRLGFFLTNVASIGISTPGLVLLTLAVYLSTIFHQLSVPLVVAHFLIANGHYYLYLLSLQVTSEIVPSRHSGKAAGVVIALSMAGQMLFTAIYSAYFSGMEKLTSYFLLTLLVTTVVKVLYLIIYYLTVGGSSHEQESIGPSIKTCIEKSNTYGSDSVTEETVTKLSYNKKQPLSKDSGAEAKSTGTCLDIDKKSETQEPISSSNGIMSDNNTSSHVNKICFSGIYHLFLWPSAISVCLCYVFRNNVTLLLQSMQFVEKSSFMVILMTGVNLLFRMVSGLVYDKLGHLHRKVLLLAVASILSIFSFVLAVIWMDNVTVLLVSVSLIGVSEGITRVSVYSLGAEIFGVDNNVFVQATQMSLTGVMLFIVSLMVGLEYDHVAESQSDGKSNTVCYGKSCYGSSYLTMAIASIPVPLAFVFLSWRLRASHFEQTEVY